MEHVILDDVSAALGIPTSAIDPRSTFAQLGGDSIKALRLIAAFRRRGHKLNIRSILGCLSIADLVRDNSSLTKLYEARPEPCSTGLCSLGNFSTKGYPISSGGFDEEPLTGYKRQMNPSALRPKTRIKTCQQCPLLEMQLSLIHSSQQDPGSNFIEYIELHLPHKIPILKRAWEAVVCLEPIFRISCNVDTGRGYMTEHPAASFQWQETIVKNEDEFVKELGRMRADSFSMVTNFTVITFLGRGADTGKSAVIWRIHHALIDGYSSGLVLRKVRKAALGLSQPQGPSFITLAEDLQRYRELNYELGRVFWEQRQRKYPSATWEINLPPPTKAASRIAMESTTLHLRPSEFRSCLRDWSATTISLYYAAWALTMSTYMGTDELVFGAVISGRDLPLHGVQDTVGPLMNVLPFHVRVQKEMTGKDFVRQISTSLLDLAQFQWTTPEFGFSRNFSSTLAAQFATLEPCGTGIDPIEKPQCRIRTNIPLTVLIHEDGYIRLDYYANKFRKRDIEALSKTFHEAIKALLVPYHTVGICLESLMSFPEIIELYKFGNLASDLTRSCSVKDDLVSLFRGVVLKNPHQIAVATANSGLSYKDLARLACRIAGFLSSLVELQEVICVHADSSLNWIVAIYGILMAGCVYCPFDPSLPAKVRDANFQATGSRIYLTSSRSDKSCRPRRCRYFFAIDEILEELLQNDGHAYNGTTRVLKADPSKVAYLCFTSGSTGSPKGVMCRHESLVAFQKDLEVRLLALPGKRVAQVMSSAFDGSIHEIFSALSYGATLRLKDQQDPFAHLKDVDSVILTPTIAKLLDPREFSNLSAVYFVGETVPQSVNDAWSSSIEAVYNMYGPTEATCGATIKRLQPGQTVTIGQPNPSTRLYILDIQRSLAPRGVIGEIYLAGVQVANGYISKAEETANRFIHDSICPWPGERMYRTGDRGFWNKNGEVVCLGRNDRVIKFRGFRIDLDDLEIRITEAWRKITSAIVVQKEDFLVAVIQPSDIDTICCRAKLAQVLPIHSLPTHIFAVDKYPITRTGKINYESLLKSISMDYNTPETALKSVTEEQVASVWREVLALSNHTPLFGYSNFVDLGGNSILQLRLANLLSRTFQRCIPLRYTIELQTIHELAKGIEKIRVSQDYHMQPPMIDEHQLSPIEKDWLVRYQTEKGIEAFNVSFACKIGPETDRPKLVHAWNCVLARHKILRCRYIGRGTEDSWRDYASCPPRVQELQYIDVWQEVNRPFDLAQEDPIRVLIARYHLVVVLSHVVSDLTTLQILLEEVSSVYNDVPQLPVVRTYMQSLMKTVAQSASVLDFWTLYLSSLPQDPISLGNFGLERTSYRGSSYVVKVPTVTAASMHAFIDRHHITMHQLSLAGVSLALQYDKNEIDIVLGAPYFNRSCVEDQQVVGLFLEPLPIRIHYPRASSIEETMVPTPTVSGSDDSSIDLFIQAVCTSSQTALAHASPWTQLRQNLESASSHIREPVTFHNTNTSSKSSRTSYFSRNDIPISSPETSPHLLNRQLNLNRIFDVMVTFHERDTITQLKVPGLSPLYTWANGSKFKLLIEFVAVDREVIVLRIEHSDECLGAADTKKVGELIIEALSFLSQGRSFADTRNALREGISRTGNYSGRDRVKEGDGARLWGTEMREIREL